MEDKESNDYIKLDSREEELRLLEPEIDASDPIAVKNCLENIFARLKKLEHWASSEQHKQNKVIPSPSVVVLPMNKDQT